MATDGQQHIPVALGTHANGTDQAQNQPQTTDPNAQQQQQQNSPPRQPQVHPIPPSHIYAGLSPPSGAVYQASRSTITTRRRQY